MTDFIFNLEPGDVIYDIETYCNIFTLYAQQGDREWVFEISDRRDDYQLFKLFMDILSLNSCRMVGYNNIGFDYPVIHYMYTDQNCTVSSIYDKAMSIINTPHNARFAHMIWERDRIVEQLDLYKIHHFDNVSKATSLKVLEFNMRMGNIEDLPFDVGLNLTDEQKDVLIKYNRHDVVATALFYKETLPLIEFREELSVKYGKSFMNHNDTKIGSDIFIIELEKNGVECYHKVNGKREPRQTPRESIRLVDAILPWIEFEQPEFQRILNWLKTQTITETKGVFKDISCDINGIEYVFGTGGIHASVYKQKFEAQGDKVIELRDVASYYPNLAIKNRFYPEHLSERFCDIYEDMFNQRRTYKKGTPENAMYKLALNGTYGNSNNQYSPFYDPLFTMKITLNGQLLLCLLAEKLIKAPNLRIIFLNTDGLSYECSKQELPYINDVCDWWQNLTQLELETDHVSRIWVADVNNYIMEYVE